MDFVSTRRVFAGQWSLVARVIARAQLYLHAAANRLAATPHTPPLRYTRCDDNPSHCSSRLYHMHHVLMLQTLYVSATCQVDETCSRR